ncbi:hypothetical protein J3E74DRAFT_295656 [Bipolaris maydis]|nr:hypothetical protein J3E74DRAFT_296235 [Bipolaris maydis]KAJ5052563.1 hypothetical protein J3E74DRAFT_295656 [Bipolaris maydis]
MDTIKRVRPTSDDEEPWKGLEFNQRFGSDRLYDELKKKYPQYTCLRQRQHAAVIAFLQQELQVMAKKEAALEASAPKQGEENSISLLQGVEKSPQPAMGVHYSGRKSANAMLPKEPAAVSSTEHGLYVTFNLSNQPMEFPHKRRKMNPTEKASYKRTRAKGACDSCKRQKVKVDILYLPDTDTSIYKTHKVQCTHNSGAATESLDSEAPNSTKQSSPIPDAKASKSDAIV